MNDFDTATAAAPSSGKNWFDYLTQAAAATADVVTAFKGTKTASEPDAKAKPQPGASPVWYKRPLVWAAAAAVLLIGGFILLLSRRSKAA